MMSPRLERAIALRIAVRAAIDRGDDRGMVRLNRIADVAQNALCPHEWTVYSRWARGPEDAPIRFINGASA
jgi:hypothetical protein